MVARAADYGGGARYFRPLYDRVHGLRRRHGSLAWRRAALRLLRRPLPIALLFAVCRHQLPGRLIPIHSLGLLAGLPHLLLSPGLSPDLLLLPQGLLPVLLLVPSGLCRSLPLL